MDSRPDWMFAVSTLARQHSTGNRRGVPPAGTLRVPMDILTELETVPLGLPPGLEVVWLGVSGYRLTYQGVSIFIDPYVSRVPLRAFVLRRQTLPAPAMVERYATAPGPVAGILVGHTHFDHAVDAPALARRYGANAY